MQQYIRSSEPKREKPTSSAASAFQVRDAPWATTATDFPVLSTQSKGTGAAPVWCRK